MAYNITIIRLNQPLFDRLFPVPFASHQVAEDLPTISSFCCLSKSGFSFSSSWRDHPSTSNSGPGPLSLLTFQLGNSRTTSTGHRKETYYYLPFLMWREGHSHYLSGQGEVACRETCRFLYHYYHYSDSRQSGIGPYLIRPTRPGFFWSTLMLCLIFTTG